MKTGIIGLGRMGEGMSRRMMQRDIQVWGYRRNYSKAKKAEEDGYITGAAFDLPTLANRVKPVSYTHLTLPTKA